MDERPAWEVAAAEAGGAAHPVDLMQAVGVADVPLSPQGPAVQPAFDAYHAPPDDLIDDCVHCGFCLPSCPTYLLFGEEMDSPRGRIYLMNEASHGEPMTASMVEHWDLCLGCLACVTACPSGVQYGPLIESTRQQVERRFPRSFGDRFFRELIYSLFPYPRRLEATRPLLRSYQRSGLQSLAHRSGALDLLPERLAAMEALMPPLGPMEHLPPVTPARGTARRTAGMLLGCVQRVFFPQVNAATARVLAAEGVEVIVPPQGCCGALSMHVGREREALRFARALIDAFSKVDVDAIVVNVAGCGSAMKEYGYWLRDDPAYAERAVRFADKVRDFSEFLVEIGPVAGRHAVPVAAVYHDACHLSNGQKIRSQPRALLSDIPGLALREVPRERDICCGSAGTYNLLEPRPARDLGDRKADYVAQAEAEILITSNPGCSLQIAAGLRRQGIEMPVAHIAEVLDWSIKGTSPEDRRLAPGMGG